VCSKIRWPVRPLTVWGFWFLGGKARSFWLSPQPQGKKVGHLCEHLCFTSWEELKDSPTDKAKSPPSQVLSAAYLLLTSEVLWKKKLIIQWIFLSINKPFHSPLSEQKHPLLTPDTRPEELVCSPLNLSHWNCFREYNTLGDKKKKKRRCELHALFTSFCLHIWSSQGSLLVSSTHRDSADPGRTRDPRLQ